MKTFKVTAVFVVEAETEGSARSTTYDVLPVDDITVELIGERLDLSEYASGGDIEPEPEDGDGDDPVDEEEMLAHVPILSDAWKRQTEAKLATHGAPEKDEDTDSDPDLGADDDLGPRPDYDPVVPVPSRHTNPRSVAPKARTAGAPTKAWKANVQAKLREHEYDAKDLSEHCSKYGFAQLNDMINSPTKDVNWKVRRIIDAALRELLAVGDN